MPDTHALLSPSSSERWIACPPSVRLSEKFDEKPSEYAAEGTAAHSLCEYKLRQTLGYNQPDIRENLDYMEIKFLIKKFNDPKFLKYDVVQANNQA